MSSQRWTDAVANSELLVEGIAERRLAGNTDWEYLDEALDWVAELADEERKKNDLNEQQYDYLITLLKEGVR